jgi:3D (Asp-Asp-Asp) domain-containing protein
VKGCKGYDVYRSTNGKQIGKKVWSTSKMAKNRFTDEGAKIKVTYYYTVKPRKDAELLRVAAADPATSNAVKNTLDVKSSFAVKAYAYTGGGTTASGKKAQVGRIAVDPRVVKLGTWVYVEGYGLAQACDTGGNIKGKTVDLYMNSERECMKWGVRYPKMYILN